MQIAIALLLTLAVATFVAWPFFRQVAEDAGAPPDVQLTPLERQKTEAYAAIKEAEFDYQMGKLTEADFATLRERYSRQALAAIAAIEGTHATGARHPRAAGDNRPSTRVAYCPSCGRRVPPRTNFCAGCGRALTEAAA